MPTIIQKFLPLALGFHLGLSSAAAQTNLSTRESIGRVTNGPVLLEAFRLTTTTIRTQSLRLPPYLATNSALATNPVRILLRTNSYAYTNLVFQEFLPGTLPHVVWTNFIAHTNGRDLRIWSQRTRPVGWPRTAPIVSWNTNSLLWGMKGFTALSPCWDGEGNPGQVPITLLTRRHGYTRGHSMGPEGFGTRWRGSNVWFVAADNSVVTRTIRREVVRAGKQGDYTLFVFDRDLPDAIQPLRVAGLVEVQTRYLASARAGIGSYPMFKTEQGGNVSADVGGFSVNTWKGGDSGIPNLLPLLGELVFCGGRSTSGPSSEMQADLDALSQMEGLDPKAYQLQWVDLSKYPSY